DRERGPGLDRRGPAHRGAHGRGHLHRLGHPRLSRPPGRVDQESRGGEAVHAAELRRRSRGAQARVAEPPGVAGLEGPAQCRSCRGILKSATISFGQGLVPEDLQRAQQAAARCDLMLTVGTKLSVYPIAGVVPVAKRARARVVIINAEPTEMDELGDAVLRGSISTLLPSLVE